MNREEATAMKIRGVRYFFSEAFKNIFSNGWMTIASIFTVVASLLVLGVFLTLSINISNMAGNLEDSYQIVVFVDEKVSDDGVKIIGSQLKNTENVADAVLTTREERLLILRDKMGENASKLDRYKDDNPLRDMYQVTLNDLSKSEQTIDKIEKIIGEKCTILEKEMRKNEASSLIADISKAKQVLDWQPKNFIEEIIKEINNVQFKNLSPI